MILKIILFLFFSLLTSSQSIDSLLSEIESEPADKQLEILSNESWNYRSKGPQYAIECVEKALEISDKLEDLSSKAKLKNFLGVINRNIGNYVSALQYYNEALQIAQSINDSVQIAYSYNNLGGAYRLERNYTVALQNMFKALEYFEKLNMKQGIAYCTINIGIVYRAQKNYDKAMEYFKRTLEIREEIGDKFGQTLTLNQIAEIYYDQRKLDLALAKYWELKQLYEDLNDPKGIAAVLGGIGGIKYMQDKFEEARKYREDALAMNSEINNVEGIIKSLNELSLIYLMLGNTKKADDNLNKAFELCNKKEYISLLIDHYKTRSDFFTIKEEHGKALSNFKRYSNLKDSLTAEVNMASIASMEALHKVDLANKENKILTQENEFQSRQNLFLLILAIILILFISFGLLKYYQNKQLNKKLRELNATKDKFFSIIAHDLKNPFNNLLGYSEMLAEDFDEMSDKEKQTMLRDFNSSSKKLLILVENLLDWSRANIGALRFEPEEILIYKAINDAISLYENSIKKKNLNFVLNIPDDLKIYTDADYFHLVTRNLISNAIKFSYENSTVKINVLDEGSHYQVDFIDEGIGIEESKQNKLFELAGSESTSGTQNESGSGLGLILVHDLVTKWGGEVKLESTKGKGSKFSVTIPKKD